MPCGSIRTLSARRRGGNGIAVRRRPVGERARERGPATDARRRRLVPGVSAVLFGIGLYGVFTRRSPIILPALGRDHAERVEPGADLVRPVLGRPRRAGLRARRHGGRRIRGRRRPRPRRRHGSAARRPRRRLAHGAHGTDEHARGPELDLPLRAARRRRGPDAGRLADLAAGRRLERHRLLAASASPRPSRRATSCTTSPSTTTTAPASTSSRSTRGPPPAASASRSTSWSTRSRSSRC